MLHLGALHVPALTHSLLTYYILPHSTLPVSPPTFQSTKLIKKWSRLFFLYSSKIKHTKTCSKKSPQSQQHLAPPHTTPCTRLHSFVGLLCALLARSPSRTTVDNFGSWPEQTETPGGANTNDGPPSYSCKRRRETRPPLAPVGRSLHNKDSCSGQS